MIEITNILESEKHINDVEVVIFDLDDTLYSEKDYVKCGYRKIAEHFNCLEMQNKLWSSFLHGEKAIDVVLESYNLFDFKDEALSVYRNQRPEISLYPGVLEMLTRLKKEKKKKLGLITDGRPEGQHAKIESLKLGDLFDKIIITDELGGIEFRKPNTKAFDVMKNYMNVAYSRMCYVGDNAKKDFIAPMQRGMKCIWFMNKEGLYN